MPVHSFCLVRTEDGDQGLGGVEELGGGDGMVLLGVDGHIGKPFDYEELCATVAHWLGDAERALAAPAAADAAPQSLPATA